MITDLRCLDLLQTLIRNSIDKHKTYIHMNKNHSLHIPLNSMLQYHYLESNNESNHFLQFVF